MGWASNYIKQLIEGKTVEFRPRGNSMTGKINSGQLCTIAPIYSASDLKKGDIVLCVVNGHQYLHLIKSIQGKQYKIVNNKGFVNGTTNIKNIYGKCIKIK